MRVPASPPQARPDRRRLPDAYPWRRRQTTDRVGDVAQRLKVLAKELDCVVIALSQMSRECEKRPDKRGQLSDLRDSGEIEQAADVVIFLYREELYQPDTPNKGRHRNDRAQEPPRRTWHRLRLGGV